MTTGSRAGPRERSRGPAQRVQPAPGAPPSPSAALLAPVDTPGSASLASAVTGRLETARPAPRATPHPAAMLPPVHQLHLRPALLPLVGTFTPHVSTTRPSPQENSPGSA